jgi:hypothetical protein
MCRRLLETLIIEVYEFPGEADQIKGHDGHFLTFNGLITHITGDRDLDLGRNAVQPLRDHKALGNQSARNRRFNAQVNDIGRVRDGLRVAAEELLHLANPRREAPAVARCAQANRRSRKMPGPCLSGVQFSQSRQEMLSRSKRCCSYCPLTDSVERRLREAVGRLGLSARAYHRIL